MSSQSIKKTSDTSDTKGQAGVAPPAARCQGNRCSTIGQPNHDLFDEQHRRAWPHAYQARRAKAVAARGDSRLGPRRLPAPDEVVQDGAGPRVWTPVWPAILN